MLMEHHSLNVGESEGQRRVNPDPCSLLSLPWPRRQGGSSASRASSTLINYYHIRTYLIRGGRASSTLTPHHQQLHHLRLRRPLLGGKREARGRARARESRELPMLLHPARLMEMPPAPL